ncbi:ribonuclease Z [Convivina intestini]|uniref:Ribonuclease Z n=1 Tax=Convivina intestini TaxID=1505726 RepID=A0A2U1D8Z7_9LACO|nr:ribonuclease Z [Convivina intestini]PVY84153.1 RNAse Z [Convivina intestini]CAH1854385.1 Ribonuclease Z [Convivina intestini]CAH1854737.1 Ribonuclease Z [Convivina intestini]SDB91245.1 ribonuclease Z [Leuconostocaceae bacterium R-53105]
MQLEFLGTGSGQPSKGRNVTSTALKLLDERNAVWLFDVGEATQHQILKTSIRPRKIEKVFISHLHGDHIFGLPGFLSSRSFQGADKDEPLTIYGPKGLRSFVQTALRVSDSHLSYPIHYVEIQPGIIFEDQTFRVIAAPMRHRIESWAFRVEEKDHAGELLVDKLKQDNIPAGPVYGLLKAGQTVQLADGRTVNGQDYIGPRQQGRIIAIVYDTRPNPEIVNLAKGADVLVHESTYGQTPEDFKLAKAHGHSTSADAARVAKEAGVGRLILTHISARYLGPLLKNLITDVRQIFPNTYVARDFDIVDIPFKKELNESK